MTAAPPTDRGGAATVLAPLRVEATALAGELPVRRTGMGPARARTVELPDGALIVAGTGGGLDPRLRPGDLVVASRVSDRDDTLVRELPEGLPLAAALRRRGLTVHVGPIVSVERPATGGDRDPLARGGALAVDCESAWIAAQAGDRPLAVVRAVADPVGGHLLDPRSGTAALRALRSARGAFAEWGDAVGPRRVLLAGPRSFCAGVDRAIDIVEEALDRYGPPVYVRKQIVHNAHVVADLGARGAVFVDELEEVPDGALVVFSAHGVSPAVRAEAATRGLEVIDATCPLVEKVHAEARRFARDGYDVVLVGHAGHEEVEGTAGEAPDRIRLVEDPADVDDLAVADPERVAFLSQTTLAVDDVAEVVGALRRRFPTLAGPGADDICYATQNRQDAVRAVAADSDLVLVVGSRNSSNSKRLVEVAEREGAAAALVDDATEIDPRWLAPARTVGLTAGASAPETLVEDVVATLAGLGPVGVEHRTVTTESVRFTLPKALRTDQAR